jgi:imidazolonepropionase-like amidohydrolase
VGLITFAGGTLIDATGDPELEDGVIVVEGRHIKAVGKRADFPAVLPGQVIDCTGKHCLPGLINSHLHLALDGDDPTRPDD